MKERKLTGPKITDPNNKVLVTERAKLVANLRLKGISVEDIARALNLSEKSIERITNYAAEHGLIEAARKRIEEKLIPKVEKVYEQILEAPASEIADRSVQKGWEVKLKAARHVADGMGVFRKMSHPTSELNGRIDLQQYAALREADMGGVIDGEVVRKELPEGESEKSGG